MVLKQTELAATGNLVPLKWRAHWAGQSGEAESHEPEHHQLRLVLGRGGCRFG